MAVQQVQNLPPQFIQDLGKNLAGQITAQTAVPVVTKGTPVCATTCFARSSPNVSTKGAGLVI